MATAAELMAGYKEKKGGKGSGVAVPTSGEKKPAKGSKGYKLKGGISDSSVGAFAQGAAESLLLGADDEIKAALYSAFSDKSYDEELELIRAGNDIRSKKYKAADVAGNLSGSVAQAAALPIGGATSLMGAVAKGVGSGAAAGAAQGLGEGEGVGDRAKAAVDGALWGGAFGGTFSAGGRAVKSLFTKAKKPAGRWTLEDLQKDKNAAYQEWRKTNEVVDAPVLQGMYQKAKAAVRSDAGYNPDAPKNAEVEATLKFYKKLFDPKPKVMKDGSVVTPTVRELHPMQLDEHLQDAWDTYKKTNNPKMLDIINTINDTINALPESSGLSKAAKAANSRYMQAKTLEHAMDTSEIKDAAGNSFNIAQRKKNALASILSDPKKARGFSQPQLDSMRSIVDGSLGDKALAILGKGAPTGNGLLQNVMILGAVHNPLVGVAAIGSSLAREASNLNVNSKIQSLMGGIDPNFKAPPVTSTSGPVSRGVGKELSTAMPAVAGDESAENTDAQNMLDAVIQQRLSR